MNVLNLEPGAGLPLWHAALVWAPALLAAVAAVWASATAVRPGAAWRMAEGVCLAVMAAAVASLGAVLLGAVPAGGAAGFGVRADRVGALVMVLVALVGWVIVRYSHTYLLGERKQGHYLPWLMATLAAVQVVLATDHILVLALAWTATSLTLHHLLTFFNERPAAVVAAHKKFIVARLADLCMGLATVLLWLAYGTPSIQAMLAQAAAAPGALPASVQVAVVLLACTAVLKCAQLPFHGWLIQVMEAPTPVSALLHAGVVNLGGFVLLRFAPLVSDVPAAQVLLVGVGAATAVLAALVMTTRISIKVMLAWSTCAQMGFMLMQCGLGAWDMALLHLLAHSLYKAHAFLGAGGAVRRAQVAQLAGAPASAGLAASAAGALAGLVVVAAALALWGAWVPGMSVSPAMWVLAGIVALAVVPLVGGASGTGAAGWLRQCAGAVAVVMAYLGLHALLGGWLGMPLAQPPAALWIGVAVAFVALFVLQAALAEAPRGALALRLYPWFYGGPFLDEKFNSLAFAIWAPPSPTAHPAAMASLPVVAPVASPLTTSLARPAAATLSSNASGAQP